MKLSALFNAMSNSVHSTGINKKWLDIMLTGCIYLFVWFLE